MQAHCSRQPHWYSTTALMQRKNIRSPQLPATHSDSTMAAFRKKKFDEKARIFSSPALKCRRSVLCIECASQSQTSSRSIQKTQLLLLTQTRPWKWKPSTQAMHTPQCYLPGIWGRKQQGQMSSMGWKSGARVRAKQLGHSWARTADCLENRRMQP